MDIGRLRSILIRRHPESRPSGSSGAVDGVPAPGEGGTPAAAATEHPTTVLLRNLKAGEKHESRSTPADTNVTPVAASPARRRKHEDIIAATVLDPDDAAVKADVTTAMLTVRKALDGLRDSGDERAAQIREALRKPGRDRPAYKTFAWNGSMDKLLEGWDETWPIDRTAGLLLDISLAVKNVRDPRGKPLLGAMLETTRGPHHRAAQGVVGPEEIWPEGAKVQSGASATTMQLLLMLEDMEVPLPQVEAILNGVIGFWSGWKKTMTGEYHTAVEVWAVYNKHLIRRLYPDLAGDDDDKPKKSAGTATAPDARVP